MALPVSRRSPMRPWASQKEAKRRISTEVSKGSKVKRFLISVSLWPLRSSVRIRFRSLIPEALQRRKEQFTEGHKDREDEETIGDC
jgi:hypothetical protein